MNEEELNAYKNLQLKLQQSESNNTQLKKAVTMFQQGDEQDNLVKWQLDIKETLIRMERLLRGQIQKVESINGKDRLVYVEDPDNKIFNEKGINNIMKILSMYVSKEIILSDYNEKQINILMKHFANKLIGDIYMNAEEYGLDTNEKIKQFPMSVWTIISIVDATYRRSKDGGERQSLKTARMVTQNEPLGRMPQFPQIKKHRGGFLNPMNWGG